MPRVKNDYMSLFDDYIAFYESSYKATTKNRLNAAINQIYKF